MKKPDLNIQELAVYHVAFATLTRELVLYDGIVYETIYETIETLKPQIRNLENHLNIPKIERNLRDDFKLNKRA